MKFLLPKQPIFFEQFKELNTCIKAATALFCEFAANFNSFEQYSVRAKDIEHKADAITHAVIDSLNKTFITPFDREDIYDLVQEMDDLVDLIEKTIQNVYTYQITQKRPGFDEFSNLAVRASAELDKLLQESFEKQKHTACANGHIIKIHELEDEADLLYQKSIRLLFGEEQNAIMIIKWKEIIDGMEMVMDKFQKVSDTLESVIVKSS